MRSDVAKRKIIVSTIIDTFNYGTVMQAVATRDILQDYGEPIFIDYYRPQWTPEGHKRLYLDRDGGAIANALRYLLTLPAWSRQRLMFRSFLERELSLCDATPFIDGGEFDQDAVYCVGSDQTWNFEENKGIDPVYYLSKVPDSCQKIAFSASFGRSILDESEVEPTRGALEGFNAISVRESSGVTILRSLGLDGIALKDPVLLCRSSLWGELSRNCPRERGRYILLYRLNKNPDMTAYALRLASDMSCEVKLVTFSPQQIIFAKGCRAVYQPTPEKWISLFRDAAYVVTDSFHGTCFSLLFQRPLTVYDPPKFSVRLSDVLSDFNISDREVPYDADPKSVDVHTRDIDWAAVSTLRKKFSRDARDFLDGCIGRGGLPWIAPTSFSA